MGPNFYKKLEDFDNPK